MKLNEKVGPPFIFECFICQIGQLYIRKTSCTRDFFRLKIKVIFLHFLQNYLRLYNASIDIWQDNEIVNIISQNYNLIVNSNKLCQQYYCKRHLF